MKTIYGFDDIEKIISADFLNNKLHHCNLLSGKKGIGKYSFVVNMASLILSSRNSGEIIDERTILKNYNLIQNGSQLDFILLNRTTFLDDEEKNRKSREISVRQIRNLIAKVQFTTLMSKNKVIVIDNIDDVNYEGQNALLKTLEEPQRNTYIFLISHNKNNVLQTIISRSNIINVHDLSFDDWGNALTENINNDEKEIDDPTLTKLFVLSNNSVGFAMDIMENGALNLYEKIVELFTNKSIAKIQEFAKNINANKDLYEIFKVIVDGFLNDLINYSLTLKENIFLEENRELINKIVEKNKISKIIADYEEIQKLFQKTETYNMSVEHFCIVLFNSFL